MLECLSGQDEGALSLSAKGNFNISKLNDVSGKGLVSFPQYPLLLVNSPSRERVGLTITTNVRQQLTRPLCF